MVKNGHILEVRKVRSKYVIMPLKPNFFSVDFYDLKSLSFEFGNDTFITFEMPRVSYRRPVGKMNISLLFRPSVIRGPWFDIELVGYSALYIDFLFFFNLQSTSKFDLCGNWHVFKQQIWSIFRS